MRARRPAMVIRGAAACLAALLCSQPAAAKFQYQAKLTSLNESGVSGIAYLGLDGDRLIVRITATGLTPDRLHPAHLHGPFDASGPAPAVLPGPALDADGDGFVEVAEGEPASGPVLLPFSPPAADAQGRLDFRQVIDLAAPGVFSPGYNAACLIPLTYRQVMLHGMVVSTGIGAGTPGEVNGSGGYIAALPVAAGNITPYQPSGGGGDNPLPEPGSAVLLAAGLLACRGRRRR